MDKLVLPLDNAEIIINKDGLYDKSSVYLKSEEELMYIGSDNTTIIKQHLKSLAVKIIGYVDSDSEKLVNKTELISIIEFTDASFSINLRLNPDMAIIVFFKYSSEEHTMTKEHLNIWIERITSFCDL